ncbi:VOC family protein [Thalassotalea maritima]|uniref:VOC family protein n=1 Tax=Thalassotalea maritima TaxID=3242416 RepID=UPI0035282754
MSVSAIPEGYHSITPYLICIGADTAIEFYQRAFAAEVRTRLDIPDGGIVHAELQIGNSVFIITNENKRMGYVSPQSLGHAGVIMMLYVDDVDTVFEQAIVAGAIQMKAVENQFYGARTGTLQDPFGHTWIIATQKEQVPEAELKKRLIEYSKQQELEPLTKTMATHSMGD